MKKILSVLMAIFTLPFATWAQNPEVEWVKQVSGPGPIVGHAIAIDQEENSYLIVNFRDTVSIPTVSGTVQLIPKKTNTTKYDMFVAKVDIDGNFLWAKHIGGVGTIEGEGITIDAAQNIYISGHYSDSIDFDPGTPAALLGTPAYHIPATGGGDGGAAQDGYYENSFLLKLNSEGDYRWVRNIYGKPNAAYGVAIDESGEHICISGRFKDTVDVNNMGKTDLLVTSQQAATPQQVAAVPYECYVVKFDSSGQYIWARKMGGNDRKKTTAESFDIHIDKDGYVYTTGVFTDSADFHPGSGNAYLRSPSAPANNIFISKLDAEGNYVWAIGMGGTNKGQNSRGSAITTDASGNVLITGFFGGAADFDPLSANPNAIITSRGISNFIAKYDSAGAFMWAGALTGNNGVEQGLGIATDDAGSVYTTGLFTDDIDLNPRHNPPYVLTSTGQENTFISKLDKDGNFLWGKQFSGDFHRGHAIAVSPRRNVFLAGHFIGTVDFNPSGNPIVLSSTRNATRNATNASIAKLSCPDASNTPLSVELCGEEYQLNGKVYRKSGIYEQIFWNTSGCDSVVSLDLTLNTIERPVISINNFQLSTSTLYSTYQWLLNGSIIPNAVNATYAVQGNGNYQVAVTNDKGCNDTSAIYKVTNYTGIDDMDNLSGRIKIHPNPAKGKLYISASIPVRISLSSMEGKLVLEAEHPSSISLEGLSPGVYFLRISDQKGMLIKTEKVVKE